MIVTRKWLEEYIDISKISTQEIAVALNSIGLEVDSISKPNIPDGVVVGYVLDCVKHPDADKLNICQVNLGDSQVQIVCGASNVAKGQYVPVATVGTVFSKDFKIKKAKLRGVESNGMICSSSEIGLPKLNDGILELDDSIGELILGKEINQYELLNDDIIEIELTANRGDCLSILGVAKDLSAYFNIPVVYSDKSINENNEAIGRILEVEYDNNCSSNLLYKVIDIDKMDTTLLTKLRVATIGIEKNTDIETMIAYATHTTGVLFNVYTRAITSKDNKTKLIIKNDENGFTTVNGQIPLSIVGIEAGYIAKEDTIVIIEASYTEPTSLAQKVFNSKQKTGEVYYKSSRGSNPDLEYGVEYICGFLSEYNASIFKGQIDFISDIPVRKIDINIDKVHQIIGEEIDKLKIENILTSLGFTDLKMVNGVLTTIIPPQRHDIVNIADVTEEIVRLVGIDNIQAKPLAIDEINRENNVVLELKKKNKIKNMAIANGFFETTTYVFTNKELLKRYGFETVTDKKDILNPITNDLNTFRTTLLLNLIQAVSTNVKQGFKSIGLFEIGTVFNKNREESTQIGFVFSGASEEDSLSNKANPQNIDLFGFGQKLVNCIGEFELEPKDDANITFCHPYQVANIIQDGVVVGFISKLHPNISKEFDISDDTYVAQIEIDQLKDELIKADDISKYQSVKRDLSVVAPKTLQYKEIRKVIDSLDIVELKQYNLVDIYSDEKLGDNESLTINFILQSDEKTLQEQDIVSIMDTILKALEDNLQIGLR